MKQLEGVTLRRKANIVDFDSCHVDVYWGILSKCSIFYFYKRILTLEAATAFCTVCQTVKNVND